MSDLTEIICVVDRSSSMQSIREKSIEAFNSFLQEQKKLDLPAKLTLTLFNTEYEIVHNGHDLKDVPPLTDETYVPGGMTALLDAIGKTIDEVKERLAKKCGEHKPKQILFVILTDGQENSSKEYDYATVKKKIEETGWEFVFLSAGLDAAKEAGNLGIRAANNYVYASQDAAQHTAGMSNFSANVAEVRTSGGVIMPDWSKLRPEVKAKMKEDKKKEGK